MKKRRRFKQTLTLEERLLRDSEQLREQAKMLGPGPTRNHLLKRIQQNETAVALCEHLNAPATRAPVQNAKGVAAEFSKSDAS
jgi:hypothetical protein